MNILTRIKNWREEIKHRCNCCDEKVEYDDYGDMVCVNCVMLNHQHIKSVELVKSLKWRRLIKKAQEKLESNVNWVFERAEKWMNR